jgi:hypothetical protein
MCLLHKVLFQNTIDEEFGIKSIWFHKLFILRLVDLFFYLKCFFRDHSFGCLSVLQGKKLFTKNYKRVGWRRERKKPS